jgi:hypothetical protein
MAFLVIGLDLCETICEAKMAVGFPIAGLLA